MNARIVSRVQPVALAALAALAVAALGLEYAAASWRASHVAERTAIEQLVRDAGAVDNLALTARIAIVPTYDPLTDAVARLRRRARRISNDPALAAARANFEARLDERTTRIETLKARRAAQRNSERYLVRFVESDAPAPLAQQLRRDLAAYLLAPDPARHDALDALKARITEADEPALRTAADHLEVALSSRRALDELTLEFLREDLASAARMLESAHLRTTDDAERRFRALRLALLAAIALCALALVAPKSRAR